MESSYILAELNWRTQQSSRLQLVVIWVMSRLTVPKKEHDTVSPGPPSNSKHPE